MSKELIILSWSSIELFKHCPVCFYLYKRLKIKSPSSGGYPLHNIIDQLMKKEFDIYRQSRTRHPIMKQHKIKALPLLNSDFEVWRKSGHKTNGIRVKYNDRLEVYSKIDDVWISDERELIVVEYKATSKQELNSWGKQLSFYAWLFRNNKKIDLKVSNTGYVVHCTPIKDKPRFANRLNFEKTLISRPIDDSWVEETIIKMDKCLQIEDVAIVKSEFGAIGCKECKYRDEILRTFQ